MQVDLEKQFPLETSPADAWTLLRDVPAVAACMPGAEMTEQVDDTHYKGKVKSKIGPATMTFAGNVEVLGIDEAKRELRLLAKGQDTKGSSSAQMDLTAWITDADDGRGALQGQAKVTVNGKVASLGGRMMTQVADQVLNQFGKNFATNAKALAASSGEQATSAAAAAGSQSAAAQANPAPANELNGIAFAWSVLVGFVKSLFQKKPASHHG
jgi:carbon monoxide dehydrogenase subunit G